MKATNSTSWLLTFSLLACLALPLHAQVKSKANLAKQLLLSKSTETQLTADDLSSMEISSETFSKRSGVTHVYFQQTIHGIPVHGAILNANITRDDELLAFGNRFVPGAGASKSKAETPKLTPEQALKAAAKALNIPLGTNRLVQKQAGEAPLFLTVFDKGKIAKEDMKVQLVYQPVVEKEQTVRLAWQVEIYTTDAQNWWQARVDASTGELLDKNNLVIHCDFGPVNGETCHHAEGEPHQHFSDAPLDFFTPAEPFSLLLGNEYKVYPEPMESPNHAIPAPPIDGRLLVADPADATASPFGWHDTNGAAGAEFTTTRGNNAHAYTDTNDDDLPDAGSSPDGGATLIFNFPLDLTQAPSTYRPAAVTNLFYWNNYIHDFAYAYGFDELSGNFQENNYGRGGLGSDYVNAEAQDGSGTNNANFSTPPDGSNPRMQMYIGTNPNPDVDGDFDNGVIVHEYGHGISNRLTGGPANVNCLNNSEQMGEGWSDWYALMMTMEPGDAGVNSRGIGTYLFGQPTNGPGIRPTPYSTNLSINPTTYGDLGGFAVPHGVGYAWATMIWDLTWALIDAHGQAAGFEEAMLLVNDGMKIQPCSPGFVDGRNAILAADLALYGGANRCLIWEVFARRGLGFSATQGNTNSSTDGVEAFDMPPTCDLEATPLLLTICAPSTAVYTFSNNTGELLTLSATGNPAGTTATFSPNPLPNGASGTLTIGNTAAAVPGTYTIVVTGTGATITLSTDVSLTVHNGVPTAPTLISPANMVTNQVSPLLTWSASANVVTYEVQLATDAGFTNVVANPTGLTSPSYQTNGLNALTTYHWRVRGVNSCGTGSYGAPFSFTTANIVCNTFTSTDVPKAISSTGAPTVTSTLEITGCGGTISDLNVSNLDITHSFVGDLKATLTSPGGTVFTLFDRPGFSGTGFGCNGDNLDLAFDDSAVLTAANLEATCGNNPAIAGTYQPVNLLSALNGTTINGTWTLTVQDFVNADGGALTAWALNICYSPNTITCYADTDNDTYGNPNVSETFCNVCGDGFVSDNTDCNDDNESIHPDAEEICNDVDDDCDVEVDEGGVCASSPCYSLIVGASPFQDSLWTVDSLTYDIIDRKSPQLAGFTVTGMNGLAKHPITGVYYMLVKVSGISGRLLCTYNLATDQLTQVGNLGDNFSSITFSPSGQLFGVTGDGATVPETLYDINPATAAKTLLATLGNGADGEVICYNPDDNMLYHWSGNGTTVFEKMLSVAPYTVTPIVTGSLGGEIFGAAYIGNGRFLTSHIDSRFRKLTTTGTFTGPFGSNPDDLRGLVFTDVVGSTVELPPNGSSTVACPALATQPTPPAAMACGTDVPPVGPTISNVPNPLTCEGTRTYSWTYTYGGNTSTWSHTYTVERLDFTVPANGTSTVACLAQATAPTPPTVMGNCGEAIVPTGPAIVDSPNPLTCEGTRTYQWTYTDCEGNSHPWSHVYTIERQPFTVPANGASTVACPAAATQPTPPAVMSNCGEVLTPTGPTVTNTPNPITCEGTRTYAWTYTDCEGNTGTWSHVYTIERQPFTVPANGGATVACLALANVVPTPPTVQSNCGETLSPTGPVVTNSPDPLVCEGTRSYVWTYTDCEGNTAQWRFVYTIDQSSSFNLPPNGSSTVECPSEAEVEPTPPVVTSGCGETLTPVLANVSPMNDCEGHRVYTFTYTDCAGNVATWLYTYNVVYQPITVPPSVTIEAGCPSLTEEPTPPTLVDNCGMPLSSSGPTVTRLGNEFGCEGSRTYTWQYKDCAGTVYEWSTTYLFNYNGGFEVPLNEENYVGCLSHAVAPVPQTLYDNCGQEILVTGPEVTELPGEGPCAGTRIYTFYYHSCEGYAYPWTFTVHANDIEPPIGNCPDLTVPGLGCVEELPCPSDYDFSGMAAQLISAGHFQDLCSGTNLKVKLDSWSALEDCSDSDENGTYTFSRTYYFSIADQCGNEYPELCSVTYSGTCQPIDTYPASTWGLDNLEEGNNGVTLATIQGLLDSYGPLVVGGTPNSLTLTQAQCVADLLEGQGFAGPLGACQQVNCTASCNPVGPDGLQNTLAANTIALRLSLRLSARLAQVGLAQLGGQDLGCISIDPNLLDCSGGSCELHVFDKYGVEHSYPNTITGLLDLVDDYLGGSLNFGPGAAGVYSTALDNALVALLGGNAQSTGGGTGCDPTAGANADGGDIANKSLHPTVGSDMAHNGISLSLAPNPTSGEVWFQLAPMEREAEVTLEVFNTLGQRVLVRKYGKVQSVSERIELVNFGSGLYVAVVKAGNERSEVKLVVEKN